MPLNASTGFIPSNASINRGSRSTGDLQSLYFKSTIGHHHKGCQQPEDSKLENFEQVHFMGSKSAKYMKYKVKEAPLLDRRSCKYSCDFAAKPLGDHICSRELAELYRDRDRINPHAEVKQKGRTSYADTFNASRTQAQIDGANQSNQAPDKRIRTRTLGGTGETTEHMSKSQSDHLDRSRVDFARPCRALAPKPNFMLGGSISSDTYRTAYTSDFNRVRPTTSSLEDLYKEMKSMTSREFKEDERMFGFRRCPFLSPGQ